MTTVHIKPNVKLAKLLYKYKEEQNEVSKLEEIQKPMEANVSKEDYEAYPPYNFSWFIEKKIAAMGCPQTVANLNYLADAGIDRLITLSPEKLPPILECKKKLKWSEIRIKEFGAPTLKQILKFIEICDRAEMRGEVIGVHCRHGRGRTGTMLACYLVHTRNMTPERAVLTVRVQRPGSCETYEQEKAVCHYHDCLRGTTEKPDYRLVEDKLYFDYFMKYTYHEGQHEDGGDGAKQNGGATECSDEEKKEDIKNKEGDLKKRVKIALQNKSNTMVINHKIYF